MKYVTALLLLSSLVAAAFSQSVSVSDLQARAKAQKIKVIISYDKFKDSSLISTGLQNLLGGKDIMLAALSENRTLGTGPSHFPTVLFLQVGFSWKGDKLVETPNTFTVLFTSNSSGWVFLKGDSNLYVLYDDHRLELHPLGQDSDIRWSGVSETLGFEISRDDLEKIVAAKKVEMKLGDTLPRKWKDDWSKGIRQLLDITKIS